MGGLLARALQLALIRYLARRRPPTPAFFRNPVRLLRGPSLEIGTASYEPSRRCE